MRTAPRSVHLTRADVCAVLCCAVLLRGVAMEMKTMPYMHVAVTFDQDVWYPRTRPLAPYDLCPSFTAVLTMEW